MKIIQIMMTPNNQEWQGRLVGLSDDGEVYILSHDWEWEKIVPTPEEMKGETDE